MNVIDLLVCVVVLAAVWNGWRRGAILQLCSLAAIVIAVWLAARFGGPAAQLLRIDSAYASVAGFAAVFIVALLVISVVARIVRRIFHFAGFGLLDELLGIVVAVVKYLLVLSVLFTAVDRLNADHALLPLRITATSRTWRPVRNFARNLLPFVDRIGEVASNRSDQ